MPTLRPAHVVAYAEGRRLREAAHLRQHQMRQHHMQQQQIRQRHMRQHQMRQHQMRRHRRRVPALVWLVAAPGIVSLGAAAFGFLVVAVGALVALLVSTGATALLVGTAGFVIVHNTRRRAALRRSAPGTAPLPYRPAAPPRPDLVWAHARNRFHALRSAYAAFECDPMQVLRLPALADVSVPSTGRFVDAFAEAQALETDALPPPQHAAGFVAAVDRAERAWRAACEAAERIRLSGLSPEERGTVERVIKLLTTARRSGCDAERLAAYSRARSELAKLERAGVLHLPRPAQSALDAAAQPALLA